MTDLLDIARKVVERGQGDEVVEAFLTHEREFQVKTYLGDVETVSSAEPRGAGVRVIRDGRVGFAFTTDMSDEGLSSVVSLARDNSAFATADDAVALPEPDLSEENGSVGGLFDETQPGVTPEQKVAFAIDLERATRAVDPRIRTVEEAVYSDSESDIALASSTGIEGAYRRTDAWCYSVAIASEGEETQVGFEFELRRGLRDLDAEDVARRSANRALAILGARKIPSGHMPVILDPYTAGQFLGVIGSALTGEAVQKGRSLFAGRLGEVVANDKLTMVDDGRAVDAPGSAPWDAEGVRTRRTEVISKGVLRSFLYDTISARREGAASTGNASRAGFKSRPSPSPSNLAFDPTGDSAEAIKRRGSRALLVQDFHGVHSGANPISGDFSVGVTGRLLEDGVAVQPVKEVTIAAPMLDILGSIVAVGDDRRWLPFGGSYGGATTLISEMTIAGL